MKHPFLRAGLLSRSPFDLELCRRTAGRAEQASSDRRQHPGAGGHFDGQFHHRIELRARSAHGRAVPEIRRSRLSIPARSFTAPSRISSFKAAATTPTTNSRAAPTKVVNESGNGLTNQRGTVGLARPSEPHAGDVQFYVNLADNAALDPNQTRWGYAVFGKVVQGMEVVDRISTVPTGAKGPFKEDAPAQAGHHRADRARTPPHDCVTTLGVAVLFISDLHIDASRPEITEQFLEFLADRGARRGCAVHPRRFVRVMGGRRCGRPRARSRPSRRLRSLTGRGCALLRHARQSRFPAGHAILLELGRAAAVGSVDRHALRRTGAGHARRCPVHRRSAYQRLRATVRDADWQRRFLALSVAARRALAGAARVGSQAHTAAVEYAITDVNADERRRRPARGRHRHACCTGTRTGPPFIPSKSMAAPARGSCSATGTPKAACCGGMQAARS